MRSGPQDVPNCQPVAGGASLCARLHAPVEVLQTGTERLSPCPAGQLPAACYELFEQPGSCYRGVCVLPWLGVQISPGVHPVVVTSPENVTSGQWVLGTPAWNWQHVARAVEWLQLLLHDGLGCTLSQAVISCIVCSWAQPATAAEHTVLRRLMPSVHAWWMTALISLRLIAPGTPSCCLHLRSFACPAPHACSLLSVLRHAPCLCLYARFSIPYASLEPAEVFASVLLPCISSQSHPAPFMLHLQPSASWCPLPPHHAARSCNPF